MRTVRHLGQPIEISRNRGAPSFNRFPKAACGPGWCSIPAPSCSAVRIVGGSALLDAIATIAAAAPFRHLETPGGRRMSVTMTNAGRLGWVSDRRGYRYTTDDLETGSAWPAMPESFRALAQTAPQQRDLPISRSRRA